MAKRNLASWGDYSHHQYCSAICICLGAVTAVITSKGHHGLNCPLFITAASLLLAGVVSDWRLRTVLADFLPAEDDQVLNQPAAEWETTDIDGKKHSLAGYRGQVVVLDFWYRGCGWCIKAMPQIKEVSDHYRGKPVVVLGMNTDRQEKDARFVVEKLMLNYPTLKLPPLYKVRAFPTLVIIDQNGMVRARHVGYSAKLREEVIKTIDGLLATRLRRY